MELIQRTTQLHLDEASAVAIGKFDGMHKGHQYLISELKRAAREKRHGIRLRTVVFTFDPSPAVFFSGARQPELFTLAEKRRAFAEMGVDVLIEFPLDKETAAIPAETFVRQILVDQMNASLVAAGADLSFGQGGRGNFTLLKRLSETYGFGTMLIDKVLYAGEEISSSRIRSAISASLMREAADMLGSPYVVSGRVMHGERLGRTIGFPTVNLTPPEEKLLPPNGVYFTVTDVDGTLYDGMTNIGIRPTVSDTGIRTVETHLFDCDADLYEKEIRVLFLHFHRAEQAFRELEALKKQLQQDREEALGFFAQNRKNAAVV